MALHRRQAHREWLRQLVHGRLALGEAGQDRAARRIGESGEREAELVGWHVTVRLINATIKYHRHAERNSRGEVAARRADADHRSGPDGVVPETELARPSRLTEIRRRPPSAWDESKQ